MTTQQCLAEAECQLGLAVTPIVAQCLAQAALDALS